MGSITLLMNTVATAVIGFIFWALAARIYPASALGVFSSVTSGVGLLATIAALGLPMTMIRHVVSAENQRELVIVAVTAIATVGTASCLVVVLTVGPHLPPSFASSGARKASVPGNGTGGSHRHQWNDRCGTGGNTIEPCGVDQKSGRQYGQGRRLVAASPLRIPWFVAFIWLRTRLVHGLQRCCARPPIAREKNTCQVIPYLAELLSFTSSTYLATIMGILPLTVVPIEVLVARGATETGYFAVAFLIAGFLNFIPSTVSQVLFARRPERGAFWGEQRKAVHGVYGLLLPVQIVTFLSAPLLLHIFGTAYATAATGCLRVLVLSTLFTGGTYLVDSMLIARDRTAAYVFINGVNAVLVLGSVGVLVRRGLTAAAVGWALGQGCPLSSA